MRQTFTSSMTGIALAAIALGGMTAAPSMAADKDAKTMDSKPMTRQADRLDKSECLKDLSKMRDTLSQDERFRSAYNADRIGRGDYNDLVDAARDFARNGMEERCQDVVAGIKDLAMKSKTSDNTKNMKKSDEKAMKKKRRMAEQRAWKQRYESARPVAKAEVSVETLTGVDVRNSKGNDVGDVADIVVANGKVDAVIISHGGFLGIGEDHYKLAADKARVATMGENDAGDMVLVVDMTEKQVQSLPKVTKENGRWVAAASDENDKTMNKSDKGAKMKSDHMTKDKDMKTNKKTDKVQ